MSKTKGFLSAAVLAAMVFTLSCSGVGNLPSSSFPVDKGLCVDFTEGTTREHHGKSKPQFCDVRDSKKYVYAEIGSQIWMAENLNYNVSGSKCFGQDGTVWNQETYNNHNKDTITAQEIQKNCDTYGRLYNWATAVGVCPYGWHLPSNTEWDILLKFIDPDYVIEEPVAVYNM
ncbi:MAG: hypothetical protein LBQ87_02045, partial [Candidatus Fibromonas sp.]|nr:hypothetical protein [Candidatus Fibromonas sp.]